MKKKSTESGNDEVRDHYDFDYSLMKPNRFAGRAKVYKQTYVVLDEDVSEVFQPSEAVNEVLRTAIRSRATAADRDQEKR